MKKAIINQDVINSIVAKINENRFKARSKRSKKTETKAWAWYHAHTEQIEAAKNRLATTDAATDAAAARANEARNLVAMAEMAWRLAAAEEDHIRNRGQALSAWASARAFLDLAKCRRVAEAGRHFLAYVKALMAGAISTVVKAVKEIGETAYDRMEAWYSKREAATSQAELELSYLRTQMEGFVLDGQLFADDDEASMSLIDTAKLLWKKRQELDVEVKFFDVVHGGKAHLVHIVTTAPDFVFDLQLFAGEPTETRKELPGGFIEVTQEWETLPEEAEYGWMAGHHRSQEIFNPAGESVAYWDDLENRDLASEYSEVRNRIFGFCPYCGEQGCDTVDADGNPAHEHCLIDDTEKVETSSENAEPVSDETGSVSIKEDESSQVELESSEVVEDNSQATETVNKEEVDTSVAEEKKSSMKGGTKMDEKKQMFSMTRISAVESENFALGCFVVSESQGEISDATAPFVRYDKKFRATSDSMATTRRASSEQIIELSMMFDENRMAESLLNLADYAIFRGAKGVEVYVRLNAIAYTKNHKPFLRPMSNWYHVTGKLVTTEDGLFTYQQVEDIPKTARIFTPWQRVNSTSQGRKSLMYAFSTTQKRFDRIRDDVTVGMTPKYESEVVTADKQADYTTRASSHDTFAKSKNVLLESYVVLFGKLDGTDGNIIANGACFKKNAQIRPVTMKGHTLKLPEHRFDQFVAMKNLKVLLRSEISDDDEKYLDIMLDKGAKAADKDVAKAYFAGFDGVLICDSVDQKIMLVANQDACKAKFDYRRTDYIHVLAEADHCGDDQKLSMQLAKILLQAGAENGPKAYQEAKDLLIANAVQSVRGTFVAHKEPVRTLSWNSELIDVNTPISLISGVLGFDVQKYPYLLRHDLEDKLSRISRDICRLNFKIQGLYLPVAPDVAAWFDLRVLKTTKRYVEVYVPGKTGYAVLLKYPSTGNNEFIVVKFLSLEEVLANIAALDTSDEIKALIADVYKSIEEGIAIVSSDPVVRHMLAGFDFDGDHALFVTDEKFVNFMRQYGQPIAVYIQEPDVDDALERVMITSMSFALHAANMAKTGNKRVGQVVNLGRFFTNALTALMAHDTTKAQRELMLNVMRKVFFNKNKFHGAKYRSLFAREEVDGIPTVNVKMNTVNYVIQSASVMALNRKNILSWLRDMDHVFRFYSELTIDAQKKLYSVAIKFAKYMKKAGFRISSNVYGLQFDIIRDESNASLIKEVALHDDVLLRDVVMRPTKNGPEGKWIGDVFTPIRRAAVDEVLTQCSVLVEQYNAAVQKAEEERQIRQMQYLTQTRDGLFNAINLFGRFDSAMGRMVRVENYDRIMKTQLGNRQIRIPANIANALRTELHRGVKADFFDLAEELTNTYRRVAKDRSYSELAERILAITRGDRMVSDICHEELMKYFLDAENIRYRRRIKLFDDVTIDMLDENVTVSDGMAHSLVGQLGRVGNDIEDGTYAVEIEDEDAYIVEMASSRIDVPVADESRFVVFFEGSTADSVKKYLDENDVACFMKSNNGKFVHMRNADNSKNVAIVVANSFTMSGMALPSSAMYMNLIAGKQVQVIASKYVRAEFDRNGYQTHSQQMLLVCEEMGAAPAAPQKQ